MVTLDDMILNPVVREQVSRLAVAPHGIIAFNGDAGSGKTTSMLALAAEFRRRGHACSIVIDDPEVATFIEPTTGLPDWDVRLVDGSIPQWQQACAAVPPGTILVAQELDYRTAATLVEMARQGRTVLTASRPVLANYLDHGDLRNPLPEGHVTVHETARLLLEQGRIGLETYKREITQNPILRMQHHWESERRHATRVRDMFSRFVTTQVADRLLAQGGAQAAMDGERRHVTCMFADIRGFTSLAEGTAPHELFHLLNTYFRAIIEIVTASGGTIDKFVGDCVMVLFGAPVDLADHEFQAVRCAQDIQACVTRLNAERAPAVAIHMGIGINTGEAITGCLGSEQRMDYTALGDTVNTAARLESRSGAGQVVIGPQTARAVAGRIAFTALGAQKLKGKTEEIEAYLVTA